VTAPAGGGLDDGLDRGRGLPEGLRRSDVHGPGYRRERGDSGVVYRDAAGALLTDPDALRRIQALAIPPAWQDVWIAPDPFGHIQATGVDARERLQYRYHALWRASRDAEKFSHMLVFAQALPGLRAAVEVHLAGHALDRLRVAACAARVTELGLFRIGSERYAREDHTYGVSSLERRHLRFRAGEAVFDYVAKAGKRRTVRIADPAVVRTLRALQRAPLPADVPQLFVFHSGASAAAAAGGGWRHLTTEELAAYLHEQAGGHFTVKEFRTWNATLLAALALSGAPRTDSLRARRRNTVAAVRDVAAWLGDTTAVARASYVDPMVFEVYETTGGMGGLAPSPARLPADPDAERMVLRTLLALHDATAASGAT
jgi:DNA topoisomerase IB